MEVVSSRILKAQEGNKLVLKVGNFLNSDLGNSLVNFGFNSIYSGIQRTKLNEKLLNWKQAYINSILPEDYSDVIDLEELMMKLENPDYNSSPIVRAFKLNLLAKRSLLSIRLKASQEADNYINRMML